MKTMIRHTSFCVWFIASAHCNASVVRPDTFGEMFHLKNFHIKQRENLKIVTLETEPGSTQEQEQDSCKTNDDGSVTCYYCDDTGTICQTVDCDSEDSDESECTCSVTFDGKECNSCEFCMIGDFSSKIDCTNIYPDAIAECGEETPTQQVVDSEEVCKISDDGSSTCYFCDETGSVCQTVLCPSVDSGESECTCLVTVDGQECSSCEFCGFGDFSPKIDCTNIYPGAKAECEETPETKPTTPAVPPDDVEEGCTVGADGSFTCRYCHENACQADYCPPGHEDESDCTCTVKVYGIKCKDCYYCGYGDWSVGGDCSNVPNGLKWECDPSGT